jgi:anti-sigma-K factor RskA
MSLVDDSGPDGGSDDIVAAEYVLGVLPADERRQASLRIDAEQSFARLVDRWEVYFAPLAAGYLSAEVPAAIKAAIDRRLFAAGAAPGRPAPSAPGLLSSLAFWRGLAVAALAVLALYIALPLLSPPSSEAPQQRLVASLSADGSDVRYLVLYDPVAHEVGLSHVAGDRAAGRDFELWVIEGQQPPASLGVIPVGATAQLPVTDALREKIATGALFAISDEPAGGSTTGQPTGPVVAAGDLKSI